ncbi:coenzyme F430 synthase [Methanobrevibacter curvatus]|uniref:UDP-N-acetylmuramoyl-L-alanyl-D-glutamate--2, 6-diaminopimelate ligase n=1 Tax=Methanobrevibacter curvatus TaxID=49547 RepID=A0A166CIV5_9EURY|nr:coenzyme F430 synthase [Methanobrevibacter curvatus]KZX14556.1 UDP-N-acetylmuramoyl-L-alanyl-D-glutamate--2,6-diaminopimelate ligase [Methanobrevibacter curvatus]
MEALVIDLTHGGDLIAIELEKLKLFNTIYLYDIYGSLGKNKSLNKKKLSYQENHLKSFNIKILKNEDDLNKFKNKINADFKNEDLLITSPIHSPLKFHQIRPEKVDLKKIENNFNNFNNFYDDIDEFPPFKLDYTHHEIVKFILNYKLKNILNNIPIIEVTGVKGKSSTVNFLKNIFKDFNPLILSSLGAILYKNNKEYVLKKNISITPANIIETFNLASKIFNSKSNPLKTKSLKPKSLKLKSLKLKYSNTCLTLPKQNNSNHTNLNNLKELDTDYKIAIFESSLGTTGIGDIGVITNLIENYSIAKNTLTAKMAKKQAFNSKFVVIEDETFYKFYSNDLEIIERINNKKNILNTFKIDNYSLYSNKSYSNYLNTTSDIKIGNLTAKNIEISLESTKISFEYKNIQSISNKSLSGEFEIETYAPSMDYILNIINAITVALTMDISIKTIKKSFLSKYGLKGRSSHKQIGELNVIEEINPGLNVSSIKNSINGLKYLDGEYTIILGGEYGITCEEINEMELINYLDDFLNEFNESHYNDDDLKIVLVDELGKSIKSKLSHEILFFNDYNEAINLAIKNNKNILFIYRSNYSKLSKR